MKDWLKPALEVVILFLLFYPVIRFMREWRGGGILKGLGLIFVSSLVLGLILVELFDLQIVKLFFEQFLLISVLALVIIFQPELRMGLVRLGETTILGKFFRPEKGVLDEIMRAVRRLARDRIGALIALERESRLESFVEGGVRLDAQVSADLLETIFCTGSSLHDGAIIVRQDRIIAAGCLFPLTDNPEISKRLGTRHRAAIGVTEESDAITLIVSEERGEVSVGIGGKLLRDVNLDEMEEFLTTHYLGTSEVASGKEQAGAA